VQKKGILPVALFQISCYNKSGKDFFKNFAVRFNIQFSGDKEFVRETKNERSGNDSHQQERKDQI